MNRYFGLVTTSNKPVPLLGVEVKGNLAGRGARITIRQRYQNKEKKSIEAIYKFPLPEAAAIAGFKVWVGERLIQGTVEERDEAFEKYDDALMQGDGAYLMDQERPNIFTLSVGNLNPKMEVIIEIDLVMLLDGEGAGYRLALPTTISPRYIPDHVPDKNGIPVYEIVHPEYAPEVPYGLSLGIDIQNAGKQLTVESPSHPIRLNLAEELIRVEFSSEEVEMDRDFVLVVNPDKTDSGNAWYYNDGNHDFYQLNLMIPETDTTERRTNEEIIFLLDCSGSMNGSSITEAKTALEICLRALSPGCSFNVYCFGSNYRSFFTKSKEYSNATLDKALKFLARTQATMGGTEILAPLTDIYNNATGEQQRTILLLTDGQVGNEQEVFALAASNHENTRVFTVGIGTGQNDHLVKGLARAGNGIAEFVHPGERIEPKMLRVFKRIHSPRLENLEILWNHAQTEQAPLNPSFFLDTDSVIFARADSKDKKLKQIQVKGVLDGKPGKWSFDVQAISPENTPLPQLWAREKIRDLENSSPGTGSKQKNRVENKSRGYIIDISKTYGILSKHTSYLGIEKRSDKDKTHGEVELRKVPALVTEGWHGGFDTSVWSKDMNHHPLFAMQASPALFYKSSKKCRDTNYIACANLDWIDEATFGKTDIVLALLSVQQVDGGFILNKKTTKKFGIDLKHIAKLSKKIITGLSVDHFKLLSTILIFEILDTCFSEQSDTWLGITEKSRRWLDDLLKEEVPVLDGQEITAWVQEYVLNNIKQDEIGILK